MSDERRIECAAKWLAFADGTTDAEVARKFLAELDAVDPLRQARGDAVEVLKAILFERGGLIDESNDIIDDRVSRALNAALAVMGRNPRVALDALSLILPLAKGYAARNTTKANQADINFACEVLANLDGASMAAMGRSESPAPPFPAWSPEMAEVVKAIAASWRDTHLSKQVDDLYNAAFPDPAREG